MIPAEIFSIYATLRENDILTTIEATIAEVLTKIFGMPFVVYCEPEGIIMTCLPDNADPFNIPVGSIGRKLRRHILYNIEIELQKLQTIRESDKLGELQGEVLEGVVKGYEADGSARVEMELTDLFNRYILYGTCPVRFQPVHERKRYKIGERYRWYVTSVVPIVNGRQARVRVRLSRTSTELPALLLRKETGMDRIICLKRIPGGLGEIVTKTKIPKAVINKIGKELGEIYNVRVI